MTLEDVLLGCRPESWGGTRGETWLAHAQYLCTPAPEGPAYMAELAAYMAAVGGWFDRPVTVAGDVVQDGHHRLITAASLGWYDLPVPVEFL